MKSQYLTALLLSGALLSGAVRNLASAAEQQLSGPAQADRDVTASSDGAWVLRTTASATCPALDVYAVRNGRTISGMASTGDTFAISKISGANDGNGHFNLTLTPAEANGPKGTIQGSVDYLNRWLDAKISGLGCNDGTVRIMYMRPLPHPEGN